MIQQEREAKMPAEPKLKMIKVPEDVREFLKSGVWTYSVTYGTCLALPHTGDRKLYTDTAKLLKAMGGAWLKVANATVFEGTEAEVSVKEACRNGEYVDLKKLYQFFETPPEVSTILLQHLQLAGKQTVLEPSAGNGALIVAIATACTTDDLNPQVTAVEADLTRVARLQEMTGHKSQVLKKVVAGDFLMQTTQTLGLFDRVIMNPPFADQRDISHVQHAYMFLKPGGILVAVVTPGYQYRSDMRTRGFREWLREKPQEHIVQEIDLPAGSFKTSGTNVRTVCLVIKRQE